MIQKNAVLESHGQTHDIAVLASRVPKRPQRILADRQRQAEQW
jgi:hypothetical protein